MKSLIRLFRICSPTLKSNECFNCTQSLVSLVNEISKVPLALTLRRCIVVSTSAFRVASASGTMRTDDSGVGLEKERESLYSWLEAQRTAGPTACQRHARWAHTDTSHAELTNTQV